MITRTVLMTLVFAVVIGCGAAAFALMTGGPSKGFAETSYATYGYRGHDDDGDRDDHDDDD